MSIIWLHLCTVSILGEEAYQVSDTALCVLLNFPKDKSLKTNNSN